MTRHIVQTLVAFWMLSNRRDGVNLHLLGNLDPFSISIRSTMRHVGLAALFFLGACMHGPVNTPS